MQRVYYLRTELTVRRQRQQQRGDTIIEVMIAFAIFSMLAVGVVTVMNMGVAMAQRSLETTLVREQLDNQAAMIRFARDTGSPAWQAITSNVITGNPVEPSTSSCPTVASLSGKNAFFLYGDSSTQTVNVQAISGTTYAPADTYTMVDFANRKSYGLWAQVLATDSQSVKGYDVYLYACWDTIGGSVPSTINTIVRVYDK